MRLATFTFVLAAVASTAARPARAGHLTFWYPSGFPQNIAVAPNGEVWWTAMSVPGGGGAVGVLEPDGSIHEFPTPDPEPSGIVAGTFFMYVAGRANGCLWRIGWFDHSITSSDCASPVTVASQVAVDDEGDIFLTGDSGLKAFSRSGAPPVTFAPGASTRGVVRDPAHQRAVVFTKGGATIGFADLDRGVWRECSLPVQSGAALLAAGPDGAFYYTDQNMNGIGRVDGQCNVSHWSLPAGWEPYGITAGPDGNIWFTERDVQTFWGKIGRLVPSSGAITEFSIAPEAGAGVIAADARGNLWFTTPSAIGRLQVFSPGDANGDGTCSVADVFYLINFLFAGGPAPVVP